MTQTDAAPAPDGAAITPEEGLPAPDAPMAPAGAATPLEVPAPMPPVAGGAAGPSRTRWFAAIGIAVVALAAGAGALLLAGAPSMPEAIKYVPADAALVIELRADLPGDQMQAVGNLLAHFPGFKDQSTIGAKVDEALSRLVAAMPGSSVDYQQDIKPILSGPFFASIRSFDDLATSSEPRNMLIVATTNGSVTCGDTFEGQAVTTESYNGVELSIAAAQNAACVADGRFLLVGDVEGVKSGLDTRKAGTGLDTSARYKAARAELGLDRLATLYLDGGSLATAMPSADPQLQLGDLAGALPEWLMAGIRAEDDALLVDVAVAPAPDATMAPGMRTYAPVHPLGMTAFAPADTLVFGEFQGVGVSLENLVTQLQANPELADALQALESFGGAAGLVDWIDDAGLVVFRQGDLAAGAVIIATSDAAGASEKVTALTTVLRLGAAGSDIEVSSSTVEGIAVTIVHIPDLSALSGTVDGSVPSIPLDFTIAAKDRYIIVGIGDQAMERVLGVKAGAGLADDAAFKRALGRSLANPQVLLYVAAGASVDWLDSAATQLGGTSIPADVQAYLDPLEGFIYSGTGGGQHGSFRIALTVSNP